MERKQIKTIAKFMGMKDYPNQIQDWNFIMMVVDKIESITEGSIKIEYSVNISWSYSPKKTGTFEMGAGGGGGETIKRTPFESIFGKFHQITVYYQKGITFKMKDNEFAETKLKAVALACYRWIEWYNRNVLNK